MKIFCYMAITRSHVHYMHVIYSLGKFIRVVPNYTAPLKLFAKLILPSHRDPMLGIKTLRPCVMIVARERTLVSRRE